MGMYQRQWRRGQILIAREGMEGVRWVCSKGSKTMIERRDGASREVNVILCWETRYFRPEHGGGHEEETW